MWPAPPPPRLLLLLFCRIAATLAADGMDCYYCGGLLSDGPAPSCAEFREALSWSLFVVRCPEDHICIKTMSPYSGEEDREFRGCGARQASFGLTHELGCREAALSDSATEFCLCDTPLCNAAPPGRVPVGLGVLLALAVAAVWAGAATAGAGLPRPNR